MTTLLPDLPNFGRPPWPGPVGLWKYTDPNQPSPVYLVVIRSRPGLVYRPTSRDQHWKFTWKIGINSEGRSVVRRVHIVQEHGMNHLTNWGAITGIEGMATEEMGVFIPLKIMTLAQRQQFETISNEMPVKEPNGEWNCQDWCKSVLGSAVQTGILTQQEAVSAIAQAERVQPLPY